MSSKKDINLFIGANFVTYLGNGIQILGAAYVSYLASGTIFSIGGVFLSFAIPQVFSSYFVPAAIRRLGSQFLCLSADLIRAILMFLLGGFVYFDVAVLPATLIITVLSSVLEAFYVPSSNSLFQRIVSGSNAHASRESSRLESSIQIAMLLSVTIGALLASRLGTVTVFLINAVSFFISGIVLSQIHSPPKTETPELEGDAVPENAASIYLKTFAQNRHEVINFSLSRIIPNVMNTVTTFFVIGTLSGGILALGLVDAIASIGFGLGAWVYPKLLKKGQAEHILTISLVITAALIYLQPIYGFILLSCTFFGATFSFGISRVAARALIIDHHNESVSESIYATSNVFGILVAIVLTLAVCEAQTLANIQTAYAVVATFLGLVTFYLLTAKRAESNTGKVATHR